MGGGGSATFLAAAAAGLGFGFIGSVDFSEGGDFIDSGGVAFFGTPAATKSTIFCMVGVSYFFFFLLLDADLAGDFVVSKSTSNYGRGGTSEGLVSSSWAGVGVVSTTLVSDMVIEGLSSSYFCFSSFSAALSSIAPS